MRARRDLFGSLPDGNALSMATIMKARHLLSTWLFLILLLPGCRQDAVVTEPAGEAAAAPAWRLTVPAWLPLHGRPRVGDYAVHRQLDREGLTKLLRRSEVIHVGKEAIDIEQHFERPDGPRLRYRLDRNGQVLEAWLVAADGTARSLPVAAEVRRSILRVKDRAPLPLASGNFAVSRIVSQSIRLDDGKSGRQVFYLSSSIPFSTLVSLSSDRPISHKQAVRLLSRIAVPRGSAASPVASSGSGTITTGWVLVRWGRGRK